MATFTKFNCFVEDLGKEVHNFATDTLKVMLTNTAPVATMTSKTDFTDLSAVNGYSAGGNAVTVSSWAQSSGIAKLVLTDPATWTATGGTIGPFRYAVLYNSSSPSSSVIGAWDYGSAVTMAATETFTVDLDQANGVLTLQ